MCEQPRNPLSGEDYKKVDQNLQFPYKNYHLLSDSEGSLVSAYKMILFNKIEK